MAVNRQLSQSADINQQFLFTRHRCRQFGVQTVTVDPYAVDREIIAMVPRQMAVRHGLFPVGLEPDGRLILAVEFMPDPDEIHVLEQELGRSVVLRLTTRGDLSFAIHYGYNRLERETREELLAHELLNRELATREQIEQVRRVQRKGYRRLGDAFAALGHINRSNLHDLKKCLENNLDMRPVGTCLLEEGVVTRAQLEEALELQNREERRLENILINQGVVDRDTIESLMAGIKGDV